MNDHTTTFDVYFVPQHFNPTCNCMIPEYWRADDPETGLYAFGVTDQDAIESLLAILGRESGVLEIR